MKKYIIGLIIIVVLIVLWSLPIIPTILPWKVSGIPECKPFALVTLKHILNLDKNEEILYRKFKPNSIFIINMNIGKCSYY